MLVFLKTRITQMYKKTLSHMNILMEQRKNILKKKTLTPYDKEQVENSEGEIADEIADSYQKEIIETIRDLGGDDTSIGGSGRKKLWNLLKRKYPKVQSTFPVGKKNRKGMLITNHMGLKNLYLKTYKERLRNRPIKEGFEEIKSLKLVLFNLRKKL